jgi:hypothetical protein
LLYPDPLPPVPSLPASPHSLPVTLSAAAEEESDPNSAEVDGLSFFVEDADEGDDDEELDPASIEVVEDIPAEVSGAEMVERGDHSMWGGYVTYLGVGRQLRV